MSEGTHGRAVLLWIDDRFASNVSPPADMWMEVFGHRASRTFRLMDLSVVLATSAVEAQEAIAHWTGPEQAGTYIFAVVDLMLPEKDGEKPFMRHGIEVAKWVHENRIPLAFLSANTRAKERLDGVSPGLGAADYYTKESGAGPWRLPDLLADRILKEFTTHVSWLTLTDIFESMHPDSVLSLSTPDASETGRTVGPLVVRDGTQPRLRAFRRFPYFGMFREFVDRWASQPRVELPKLSTVRASISDCDEYVQQSLCILLHERFLRAPHTVRFAFGAAHDDLFLQSRSVRDTCDDRSAICVMRLHEAACSVGHLARLLDQARRWACTTIIIVPNDESAEQYTEVFRATRVAPIAELQNVRQGEASSREELARRACALAFQTWQPTEHSMTRIFLRHGWLAFPQLLINPINWMALLEPEAVALRLSDPFELIHELYRAMAEMTPPRVALLAGAVERDEPIPYDALLRVGESIVTTEGLARDFAVWVEQALDSWLVTSRQFPYGVGPQFAQRLYGKSASDAWAMRSDWNDWEENAYDTLAHLCVEFEHKRGDLPTEASSQRTKDLVRVCRFVKYLGGVDSGLRTGGITWEKLEALHWPHHRYPMPGAISRRLQQAGRYLYIQPKGLDLATALPHGLLRYRGLSEIVGHYEEVLLWTDHVAPLLPSGWRENVRFLTDLIRDHRIGEAWEDVGNNRDQLWHSLLGLLRNGLPVMFVADQTMRGKRLTEDGKSPADDFLSSADGYGKVLSRLRGSRSERLTQHLFPAGSRVGQPLLREMRLRAQLLEQARHATTPKTASRARDVGTALCELVAAIAAEVPGADQNDSSVGGFYESSLVPLLADTPHGFLKTEGWYPDRDTDAADRPMASLLSTKLDYVWEVMDTLTLVNHATCRIRHFDGYHLLSAIHDLRLENKDTRPQVGLSAISVIMDLYVAGIQGLIAHLAWCLELAGEKERAAKIRPPNIEIRIAPGFAPPPVPELNKVLRVQAHDDHYAVYCLGIPGKGSADRLSFQTADAKVVSLPQRAAR